MRPPPLLPRRILFVSAPLLLACSGIWTANEPALDPGQPRPVDAVAPRNTIPAPPVDATVATLSRGAANVPGSNTILAQRVVEAECAPAPFTDEPPAVAQPGRQQQVEAFLADHPEAVPLGDLLVDWLEAGEGTVESALPAVTADLAAAPIALTVTKPDWQAVIILNWARNTSEDWGYFTNDMGLSLTAAGIAYDHAQPYQRSVRVSREGAPTEIVDLTPLAPLPAVGYAVLQAGQPPVFVEHAMPDDVATQIGRLLGKEIPVVPGN